MKIKAAPIDLKTAQNYIDKYHRHHKHSHGDKYRVAAVDENNNIIGVIQVGRPVNRNLDNGTILEVLRCCSNGERNVCSFLYSRAARIAKEMGYKKIITYILGNESGSSLKASGWHLEQDNVGGGSWDTKSRKRQIYSLQLNMFDEDMPKYPICKKQRWAKEL